MNTFSAKNILDSLMQNRLVLLINSSIFNNSVLLTMHIAKQLKPSSTKLIFIPWPMIMLRCFISHKSHYTFDCHYYLYLFAIAINKHCQRHYGPRRWLLWPVILFRWVWLGRFGLVGLVWYVWFGRFGLVGLVWFGMFGLVGLVWYVWKVWFGRFGCVGLVC